MTVRWKQKLCGLCIAAVAIAAVAGPLERGLAGEAAQDAPRARARMREDALAKRVERANRLYEARKFREANNLYRGILRRVGSRRSPSIPALQEDPFTEEILLKVRDQVSPQTREAIIDALLDQGDRFLAIGDEDAAVDEYEKVFLLDARNRKASAAMDRARARAMARIREERESITAHAE